ncbi:ABC transporter substrate-binding protein [Oceaniglobus ichthyenteri]|uniref:ABC transporter substrate-binding protein n=1 Tax=Oceaniglobus ichthyenteri TaxID=2136177 RepID=UPI000D3325D9|nr:ABC transporter substrate-binding protein [Oceaniglobus ichthyenteri]
MTITRRRTLALMGGTVAAGALAAPAIASGTKTVVGALRLTSHAASFVAEQRGYFTDAGMDAELRFFDAAQPMAVAIASGDVDFGITAMTGALISLADKGAVRVIGGALQEEPGVDGQKILVSDAAFQNGITEPAMLAGKKWAVTQAGSSFHYMGSKMAQGEGIELQFTPLQKVGAIIGAMKSGQVDGWAIVPHIAKALAGSGAVHMIGDVADYLPNYQVTTVFTSARNTTDEAAKTRDFMAVFAKGVADFNAALVDKTQGEQARDDMVRLIHNYVYTDRPYEAAAPSILNGAMRLNGDGALNMASLRDQLAWFQAEDLVDDAITLDTIVNTDFAPQMS